MNPQSVQNLYKCSITHFRPKLNSRDGDGNTMNASVDDYGAQLQMGN